MFLREEEKNIVTGILGAVAVHLLILVVALFVRFDRVYHLDHNTGPIEIKFDQEDFKTMEQMQMERIINSESQVEALSQQELVNAVSNAASEMVHESAYDIEKQIMEEEGIEDLNPEHEYDAGEIAVVKESGEDEEGENTENEAVKVRGNVTLEYELGDRKMIRSKIPSYKCYIAGKITVAITVNRAGKVIAAKLLEAVPDNRCLVENSLSAARATLFSVDQSAPEKEEGTITYKFSAQ